MKHPKLNSKGFGLVGVLLIVLVLVAAAGVGVYAHHRSHKAKMVGTTSNTKPSTTTTKPAPTETQQYIAIQEWGVRVPMPSNVAVSDIYYAMGTDTQNSSSPEVGLASHKLDAITSDCVPQKGTHESPFGWIERMTPTAYRQALADSQNTGIKDGTLLGSYYYVWQAPRANCYSQQNGNSQFLASLNQLTNNGTQLVDNFPTNMSTVLKGIQVLPQ